MDPEVLHQYEQLMTEAAMALRNAPEICEIIPSPAMTGYPPIGHMASEGQRSASGGWVELCEKDYGRRFRQREYPRLII